MKITLNAPSARSALDMMAKITGADRANIHIEGQDIYCTAEGFNKSIKLWIEGDITATGDGFGFSLPTLRKLLAGREYLELKVKGGTADFRSKSKTSRFSGTFQLLPLEEVTVVTNSKEKPIKLDRDQMETLVQTVKRVRITNLFTTDDLNLFIRFNRSGLYATMYDSWHLAYAHCADVTTDSKIDFCIALPIFEQIKTVSQGEPFAFTLGQAYISAEGKGFSLSLPLMQGIEGQSFEQVQGLVEKLEAGNDGCTVDLNSKALAQTIEGFAAISEGDDTLTLKSAKGLLCFNAQTNFGTAKERKQIKVDWPKGSEFTLNPNLFMDTVNNHPGEDLSLRLLNNMVICTTDQDATHLVYACLLVD